jgi:hypothetical protein
MDASAGAGSIISNLINTGIQLWGASEQQGAMNKAADAIQAATYHPVDLTQAQADTVTGKYKNFDDIASLTDKTNNFITQEALNRVRKLVPGYSSAMKAYANAGRSFLNGQLPYSDVMGIVGDQNELSNSLGIPGSSGAATLKDLGLSRLSAIQSGGGILKDMVGLAGEVSPTSNYMMPQSMYLTPSQTLPLDITQAENVYASDQGILNAAAQRAQGHAAADMLPWQALQSASTQAVASYNGSGGFGGGGSQTGWSGSTGSTYTGMPAYYNGRVVPRAYQ